MKTLVLVNPASAAGRTGRDWSALEPTFRKHLGQFDVHMTRAPGEATAIARAALAGDTERIVAVGGDGTNHEVVNGFFDPASRKPIRPRAIFGFVPRGTGGDFGRTFALGKDLDGVLARIAASPAQPIDLISCTFTTPDGLRWAVSINIASAGQGGDVVARVNRGPKWPGGAVPFALAVVQGTWSLKPWRLRLVVDDGPAETVLLRNIGTANGQFQGGGMQVAPQARVDDGILELIAMEDVSPLNAARIGLAAYKGKAQDKEGVWHRSIRKVVVEPEPGQPAMLVELDGEQPGVAPVTFEVMPGALRLAV